VGSEIISISGVREGRGVGEAVGSSVGRIVGAGLGYLVGEAVGSCAREGGGHQQRPRAGASDSATVQLGVLSFSRGLVPPATDNHPEQAPQASIGGKRVHPPRSARKWAAQWATRWGTPWGSAMSQRPGSWSSEGGKRLRLDDARTSVGERVGDGVGGMVGGFEDTHHNRCQCHC
jgi:hypothetical protein